MKNILFIADICERGTTQQAILLARGNCSILGNSSFFACINKHLANPKMLQRMQNEFGYENICIYQNQQELSNFITQNKIDFVYFISDGKENVPIVFEPLLYHAVFTTKYKQGTIYASISNWLNQYYHTDYPVLPHIVENFKGIQKDGTIIRKKLGISQNSIVFGCYGGKTSFNIPFVKEIVAKVAEKRSDIHFLFMNHEKFCTLPNVHFLPGSIDLTEKAQFIDSCTGMLHARADGETFGLAVGEFSTRNKPVITYKPGVFHYMVSIFFRVLRKLRLGKFLPVEFLGLRPLDTYAIAHLEYCYKAIAYTSKKDLKRILLNFEDYYNPNENYDCYSERFSEENVMKIFKEFL